MTQNAETSSHLIQVWGIQSNILLMLRSIAITALSVLYAAALVLLQFRTYTSVTAPFLALMLMGIAITIIWWRVQCERGIDVDYLRTRLFWSEHITSDKANAHKVMASLVNWRSANVPERDAILDCMLTEIRQEQTARGVQPDEIDRILKQARKLSRPDCTRILMASLTALFFVSWIVLFVFGWRLLH